MRLQMNDEKFEEIVRYSQEYVDATPDQVADFIDGGDEGWDCGDEEQQEWLDSADVEEISGWVIAGLR